MWWRYLVGAAGALLLAGGGLLWWKTTAIAGHTAVHGAAQAGYGGSDTAPGSDPDLPEPPAASEKTKEQRRFSRYDHDKDGAVSREEFLLARHKNFAKLDKNGDGVLSFDEYAAKAVDKFTEADADHNGKLSPTEFATTRVQRKAKPRANCPPQQAEEHKSDDDN